MFESHFLTSSHMQVHTILHLLAKFQRKILKNKENICPKIGTFRSMFHFMYVYSNSEEPKYRLLSIQSIILMRLL